MAKEKQTSSKLQETLDKLNKAYGQGSVITLDNKKTGKYDIIPFLEKWYINFILRELYHVRTLPFV